MSGDPGYLNEALEEEEAGEGDLGAVFCIGKKALVYTATIAQVWMAVNKVQVLEHPLYLLDLDPADYYLFLGVKEELAGIWLLPRTLKTQEGLGRGHQEYWY
jgi:hypothetical protein